MTEEEKTENEYTTITIRKKTKLILDKEKIIPQEPYDDLINRMIKKQKGN